MGRIIGRAAVAVLVCLALMPLRPLDAQAGAAPGAPGDEATDVDAQIEAVRCAEIGFSRSAETGDWEAFESFVHPEARFPQSAAVGAADVATKWRAAFSDGQRSIRWRPRSVEILEPGRLALSRGPYRVLAETEEGSSETWGSFNSIWTFSGGRWRVIFDLGSEGSVEGDRELLLAESTDCPDR